MSPIASPRGFTQSYIESPHKDTLNEAILNAKTSFEKDISFIEHQLKNFYEKYKYPFRSKKTNQRLLNYLPLKVDYIILKESIFSFNVKNVFLCIYYFLKRLKNYISIKDKNNFPENL